MTQQLNLLDPRFAPRALRFSAQQGLLAVAGALLLTVLASGALRWAGDRAAAEGRQAEADQAPLRARVAALGASAATGAGAELQQLQTLDAGQRRKIGRAHV